MSAAALPAVPVSLEEERGRREREAWRSSLITNAAKKPEKILANALVPLRLDPAWRGVLRYNSFSYTIELAKPPPWEKGKKGWKPRAWIDYDDGALTEWLQRHKIMVGVTVAAEAAQLVSYEHQYHPVRDYLNALRWDKKPRLFTWLTRYFGAEASAYHEAVGPRWLISCIARVMAPGPDCKTDCVLILEGDQGLLKSTALRVLAGPWFLDHLRKFGARDSAMQLTGRWIIELAELSEMNEVTIEACKAFLSQNMDCIRQPYGRRVIDAARQCVFAATTNKNVFLRDETGDRRFWPVACTKIDLPALKADRDQLWAEALHQYNEGRVWWLETPELRALAEEEQAARFDSDPWEAEVKKWLKTQKEISPEQVLTSLFSYEKREITKSLRNRISSILRHLDWQRVQVRSGSRRGEYIWIQRDNKRL